MPTIRINHDATQDFIGARINTLIVTGAAARAGNERRYVVQCQRCNSQNTARYGQLRNGTAKCLNASCGKPTSQRERLAESQRIAAQKQAELDSAVRNASVARMDAETADYVLPDRYAPLPSKHTVMSERERIALREHREQVEAERLEVERPAREKAEREQRRIAELQAENEKTVRQIHATQRERIVTGADDEFTIDPATTEGNISLPQSEVAQWHEKQFAEFLRANPGYYRCDENATALTDYLTRNAPGLVLISAAQLTAAYKRLNEFGLLKQRPAPKPAEQPKRANLSAPVEPAKPSGPKTYRGRDQRTGEMRDFSEFEVRNMGADEYKKTFGISSTFSELFTEMSLR